MSAVKNVSRFVVAAVIAASALSGCAQNQSAPQIASPQEQTPIGVLDSKELSGLSGQEMVDRLDTLPLAQRPVDLMASVRADELVVTGLGAKEETFALPADEFYISIAPFVNQTHDCFFHSLTTCVGELQNQEVHVLIVDSTGGTVLVDEDTTTFDNGFVGYWLPKDIEATATITHENGSATAVIATGPEDPTCVTTIHLT